VRPSETIEYSLRFAAAASPWWLALLLPLAAAAGWALYRAQFRSVARPHAAVLAGLRMALLAGLVFLAFRPSLVRRRVLTYEGRVLLVVDDSESMATPDNRLGDAEALHLHRRLWSGAGAAAPLDELAQDLHVVEARMREFQEFCRTADRSADAFWDRAAAVQKDIEERFRQFDPRAVAAAGLGETYAAALAELRREAGELHEQSRAFFTGSVSPPPRAFDRFCDAAAGAASRLLALQAQKDSADLAAGAAELASAAAAVRDRPRIELVARKLAQLRGAAAGVLPPGQFVRVVHLTSGRQEPLDDLDPASLAPRAGVTDLLGRVEQLAAEPSDFPLTAVVLLTDGRDLSGRDPAPIAQALSRRQVPVFAAGVGAASEPLDLAVLDVAAPPFAAAGAPVDVRVDLKTSLDGKTPVRLELRRGGELAAAEQAELGNADRAAAAMRFTPEAPGLFRCVARAAQVPGEAVGARNNAGEFALRVRPGRCRVLLLDWKPRWETRFALNVFRRLGYADVNAIVVLAEPQAALRRGVVRGTWPEDRATLDMYDLVVLGELPEELLTPREWDDLRRFVIEGGRTVCFLGSAAQQPLADQPALAEALLPVRPVGRAPESAPDDAAGERAEDFRLTDAGRLHPLTRLLDGAVAPADAPASDDARDDAQVLMVRAADGRSVVAARLAGEGKTVLIGTDRLWKALNPTALDAHGELYAAMLTWAIEGGWAGDGGAAGGPRLALDVRAYTSRQGVQVWARGVTGEAAVRAVAADGQTFEAPLAPAAGALRRAAFGPLPPGKVTFDLGGDGGLRVEGVLVVEDYPELKHLARDDRLVQRLAEATGGAAGNLTDLDRLLRQVRPRRDVRKDEAVWRMWDAATVLALILGALTVEWVYRKLVGLV